MEAGVTKEINPPERFASHPNLSVPPESASRGGDASSGGTELEYESSEQEELYFSTSTAGGYLSDDHPDNSPVPDSDDIVSSCNLEHQSLPDTTTATSFSSANQVRRSQSKLSVHDPTSNKQLSPTQAAYLKRDKSWSASAASSTPNINYSGTTQSTQQTTDTNSKKFSSPPHKQSVWSQIRPKKLVKTRPRSKSILPQSRGGTFSPGGGAMSSDEEHPPHLVYESFPEYKEETPESGLPTLIGELKRKFNGAVSRKDEHSVTSQTDEESPRLGGGGFRKGTDSNLESTESLPTVATVEDGRERKVTIDSTVSLADLNPVEHSEANKTRIILRYNLLKRRMKNKEHLQRYWMPDNTSSECYNCLRPFTKIRRRHHCRICGNIFCNNCCSNYLSLVIGVDVAKKLTERTCNFCRETAEDFCSPNNLPTTTDNHPLQLISGLKSSSSSTGLPFSATAAALKAPDVPSWVKKLSLIGRSESYNPNQTEEMQREKLLQDCLVDLERIWQEMMESVKKLPFVKVRYRLRTYTDCMSGKAIVEWLRQNEKISGGEADLQGLWLGQALLDAKFLTPLNKKNTEFKASPHVFYRSGGENAFVTSSFSTSSNSVFGSISGAPGGQDGSMQQHQGEPVWVQHVLHDTSSEESDKSELLGTSTRVRDLSESFSTRYSGTDVFPSSPCSMNPDHRAILAQTLTDSYQFSSPSDPKFKTPSLLRQTSSLSAVGPLGSEFLMVSLPTHFEDAITNEAAAAAGIPGSQVPGAKQERDEAILNERQSVQEIVRNSYLMHMIAFLHQLLCFYDVSFDWAQYIFKFAKSLGETVKPNVRAKDSLDIRKYIKVKSIAGGSKEDSRIINGLAFSGNVTCKGMCEFTKKPSYVLLCRGSIECNNHRDSCGDPTRLVSLQTVWGQKKDYNQLCVKRILSVTPSVSLVLQEFTVVPRVQNLLMDANIAVVKNVKKCNLNRLARILDCEVAERVENLGLAETKPTKPGAYKQFYVETIRVGSQNKSMCVFDDCAREKFATVVLRGSQDVEELRKVKQVLLEMVMANYNRVSERSYLIDANAQQRTYFKHLPFTAKIMEFTSKYLWKVLPENQLTILYKRSDAVQSLVTNNQPIPQCTTGATTGNKIGRKIQLSNIRTSSVSWEGGPPYDPILYEPHENSLFHVHRHQFRSTVLSTSPHVLIDCPFLESNLGFNSPLRRYIFKDNISNVNSNDNPPTSPSKYWSGSFPGETPLPPLFKYDGDCENLNDVEPEFDLEMLPFDESAIFDAANIVELPPHPFLSYVTSKSIDGPEFQNLLADFRLRGYSLAFDDIRNIAMRHKMRAISKRKAFEAKMNKRWLHHQSRKFKPDCLDYRYHQKINLLVLIMSNQPTKDPNKFCCFLVYRKFHFYMHHDLTLGQFLERLCFNDKVCINSQCELPAEVHTRRFLNGNYCLQVSIHNPEFQGLKQPPSDILMWNFCPYCKKLSQISQMSEGTWNYSFGKFLENCLSAFNLEVSNLSNANKSSEDSANPENLCCHSLFREHHQYFMLKKRIAAFRVFSVGVYEVAFPEKFHPAGNYSYHVRTFTEEQKAILAKLEAAVTHIYQRINTCNEHLKSRAENAQNTSASAKRRAYVSLFDLCVALESMLVAEKEACLHSMKKEEEKCKKTSENSGGNPTCAPSDSIDWLRFDSILMMKHHVAHFCDSWNQNLAKLAKAETEFKNYFYKERAFNIPLLRTNTPEDVKVMGTSPMGSDKEGSGKFESSIDGSCGESKTPNGSIVESMFETNSDVENTFTTAGTNSDEDSAGNVTTISQPISVSSSASVNNGVIFDVDIGKEGQGRCVEKGIHFVIDRLTLPPNASPASSAIEDSYDMIDNTRSEGSNLRRNSTYLAATKKNSNFLSRVPSNDNSFASTPSLLSVTASNSVQNGADISAATANDINKRITVTYDGQNFAGTLKWVGYLELSDPRLAGFEMGGIELDEPQPRAGDGVYNGVCVFECPPQKAIFVPLVGIFLMGNENTSSVQDLNVSNSETVKANVPKSKMAELANMSPFSADEHFISCEELPVLCPILIRESQPASIIAYSMASSFYRAKVAVLEAEHLAALNLEATSNPPPRYTSFVNSNNNSDIDLQSFQQTSPASTTTTSEPSVSAQVGLGAAAAASRLKQQFVEHSFSTNDKKCFFYCKTWYPVEFKNLRKKAFSVKEGEDVEKCFVKCLGQTFRRFMTAGRSKALFFETESHRFIIKSIRAAEVQDFVDPVFASSYFGYLNDCLDNGKPSALCKIYGVFKVSFKNSVTDQSQPRSQQSFDLVVMENLFYIRDCSRKFDLKGVHKNMTQNEQSYKEVIDDKKMILDQHMTTVMQEDPIYTRPHSKHFLMEAIARDSKFLADNGRIDYSLLIGLDDSKNEMVVGIVDYVRKFGLDKRFEMVSKTVKIYFQKTGSTQPADPREMMPTIVSPDLYYERFIIQMQQFILAVPDRWFGLESGPDKWTCGVQGQGWSAYTAGGGGGRSEKVQNLDPYPSFLNYWDPVVSSRSNTEEN